MARRLPMFPLGTVLFPYATLPLHVFEERYRAMVQHVMTGDREFGVVLIERGSEVGGGDTRFGVGTLARIVQMGELPDGRYALVSVGLRPIRVVEWLDDDPYPVALVDDVAAVTDDDDVAAARAALDSALGELVSLARTIDPEVADPPEPAADADRYAYEIAAVAPIGPLDAQRVLEAPATSARLRLLAQLVSERAADVRARLRQGE